MDTWPRGQWVQTVPGPGKGRKVIEGAEGYQVREGSARYGILFGAEKDDIGLENTYSWEINTE